MLSIPNRLPFQIRPLSTFARPRRLCPFHRQVVVALGALSRDHEIVHSIQDAVISSVKGTRQYRVCRIGRMQELDDNRNDDALVSNKDSIVDVPDGH